MKKQFLKLIILILLLTIATNFLLTHFLLPTYTATLDDEKIQFKGTLKAPAQVDLAIDNIRDLSTDEAKQLFGDMSIDAYVGFHYKTNDFIILEGTLENLKIIAFRKDTSPCTILKGLDAKYSINGIPVITGYYTLDNNIIFFASFTVGNYTVYLENHGIKTNSQELCNSLVAKLKEVLEKCDFDYSLIKFQEV